MTIEVGQAFTSDDKSIRIVTKASKHYIDYDRYDVRVGTCLFNKHHHTTETHKFISAYARNIAHVFLNKDTGMYEVL